MNLYILEIIGKFIRLLFLTFISIFNIDFYSENTTNIENTILNKDNYAVNSLVVTDTNINNNLINQNKVNQNSQVKTTNKPIVNNATVKNNTVNKNKTTMKNNTVINKTTTNKVTTNKETSASNKVITSEKPVVALEEYTGRLTGYGPDCVGCSGKGNLACRTKDKKTFSLVTDGIYYTDDEYGKVRILAAATSKFKCGTIVVVTKPGMEPFTGIVLDTGGSMRQAWSKGEVWMDLAYSSNAMSGSDNLTGKNIKFSIQRLGW